MPEDCQLLYLKAVEWQSQPHIDTEQDFYMVCKLQKKSFVLVPIPFPTHSQSLRSTWSLSHPGLLRSQSLMSFIQGHSHCDHVRSTQEVMVSNAACRCGDGSLFAACTKWHKCCVLKLKKCTASSSDMNTSQSQLIRLPEAQKHLKNLIFGATS